MKDWSYLNDRSKAREASTGSELIKAEPAALESPLQPSPQVPRGLTNAVLRVINNISTQRQLAAADQARLEETLQAKAAVYREWLLLEQERSIAELRKQRYEFEKTVGADLTRIRREATAVLDSEVMPWLEEICREDIPENFKRKKTDLLVSYWQRRIESIMFDPEVVGAP